MRIAPSIRRPRRRRSGAPHVAPEPRAPCHRDSPRSAEFPILDRSPAGAPGPVGAYVDRAESPSGSTQPDSSEYAEGRCSQFPVLPLTRTTSGRGGAAPWAWRCRRGRNRWSDSGAGPPTARGAQLGSAHRGRGRLEPSAGACAGPPRSGSEVGRGSGSAGAGPGVPPPVAAAPRRPPPSSCSGRWPCARAEEVRCLAGSARDDGNSTPLARGSLCYRRATVAHASSASRSSRVSPRAASPVPSALAARVRLRSCSARIPSSTVSRATRRCTITGRS